MVNVSQHVQETEATGHERTSFDVGPEREALAHQARERVVKHQDIRPGLLNYKRALGTLIIGGKEGRL